MYVLAVAEPVAASSEGGGLGVSPAIILVFGFVFLILLQAWFVRRIARLRTERSERKSTYEKLREEVVALGEQVSSLERAKDSNDASITALERETEVLQKLIDNFTAEHGELAEAQPASASSETADTDSAEAAHGQAGEEAP